MARIPNLNRLTYFVAAAEHGSFTAAARHLRVSKAVVSKHIQRLEDDLQTSLITRNTRNFTLTHAGQALYPAAKTAVQQADEAYRLVKEGHVSPSGTLKIGATLDYGANFISRLAGLYTAQYPDVRIELYLSDEKIDIISAGLDVTFRLGWLKDSSNRSRKLSTIKQHFVCSPDLLKRYPKPETPEDLGALPFIENRALSTQNTWPIVSTESREAIVKTAAPISVDITVAAKTAALAGGGFVVMPDFLIEDEIMKGQLVKLLPNWSLKEAGIYAVFPPTPYKSTALKAFMDLIKTPMKQ